MGFHHLGRLGRLGALVCLAGLGLKAEAFVGVESEYVGTKVVNTAAKVDAAWAASNAGSGTASLAKDFAMRAPGGRSVATRYVVGALAAEATAGVAASILPTVGLVVGVGSVLYDVYQANRVRADGNGGIVGDLGRGAETVQSVKCGPDATASWGMSPLAACQPQLEKIKAQWQASSTAGTVVWQTQPSCTSGTESAGTCSGTLSVPAYGTAYASVSWSRANQTQCPAYTDSLGVSHPAGEPKLTNGQCPSGVYSPMTVAEAEARLRENWQSTVTVDMKSIWDEILGRTSSVDVPASATHTVETPSAVAGPVTVTQNSDGTSTTEAVGWSFSRISDGLRNKDFNVMETKTTTVKDGAGNVVSQKTTGTTGQTAGDVNKGCDLNPGSLGCIGLGEVPTDQVPKSSKALSWESSVLGLPVGCPADWRAAGLLFSYQSTCDTALKMKPFILAGAAFAALMIVLATLRGG